MGTRRLTKRLAVVAIGLAALLIPAAPVDSAIGTIAVKGYTLSGGVVQVTLQNTSSTSFSGTLAVEATVNNVDTWGLVPVTLNGGQCTTFSAAFTGTVTSVTTVGIITDSGEPF